MNILLSNFNFPTTKVPSRDEHFEADVLRIVRTFIASTIRCATAVVPKTQKWNLKRNNWPYLYSPLRREQSHSFSNLRVLRVSLFWLRSIWRTASGTSVWVWQQAQRSHWLCSLKCVSAINLLKCSLDIEATKSSQLLFNKRQHNENFARMVLI